MQVLNRRTNALLCATAAVIVNFALLGSILLMFDSASTLAALSASESVTRIATQPAASGIDA